MEWKTGVGEGAFRPGRREIHFWSVDLGCILAFIVGRENLQEQLSLDGHDLFGVDYCMHCLDWQDSRL